MGYLLVGVGLLVLAVLAFVILGRFSTRPGQPQLPSQHPPLRTEPSADEATPARSSTATPAQADHAQKRTPPS